MKPVTTLLALVLLVLPAGLASQSGANLGVGSTTGLVVSSSDIASDTGAAILAKGGNAVDAAVATAFALAVTYPTAGNIGGGGFMVIRMADGKDGVVDYRETAPLKASKTMFLDAQGNAIPDAPRTGHRASGVPGTVSGMALARNKFGSLPWKDLLAPAIRLAEQ